MYASKTTKAINKAKQNKTKQNPTETKTKIHKKNTLKANKRIHATYIKDKDFTVDFLEPQQRGD